MTALAALPIFEGCDESGLRRLEALLAPDEAPPGDVLMRQGEAATWFGVILDGEVLIERTDHAGSHRLGTAGSGSVVGELALLRGVPRSATVTAQGRVAWLAGDRDALVQLLSLPGLPERVTKQAAQKLAAQAEPVAVTVNNGARYWLRPLLPGDREELLAGIDRLSEESRRRRFFTGGPVPSGIVDYLVDLDYTNHFAWVAYPDDADRRGAGVARYIRLHEDPAVAELAVAVVDEHQGMGLGSRLVGALGVAAEVGGVARFSATALADNRVVRRLLSRAGAQWRDGEPGEVAATVDVRRVAATLPPELAVPLRSTVRATLSASLVPLV